MSMANNKNYVYVYVRENSALWKKFHKLRKKSSGLSWAEPVSHSHQ